MFRGESARAMNPWEQVLARIETKVNRYTFHTWFRPTTFIAEDRASITVRVPALVFEDWLPKHYSGVISEALAEANRPNLTIRYVCDPPADAPMASGAPVEEGAPPAGVSGLNPRYTFDSFIVGSSNQFAHAACRAVAEAPSRSYNPLFIYGGVGLGKTHLMHAVGQYVL